MVCFSDSDLKKDAESVLNARSNFERFSLINSLLAIIMVLPSLLFIVEKPPSPPSMLATKPRPIQTLRAVLKEIFSNRNYIMIFIYFQLVNTVTVFGAEISTYML